MPLGGRLGGTRSITGGRLGGTRSITGGRLGGTRSITKCPEESERQAENNSDMKKQLALALSLLLVTALAPIALGGPNGDPREAFQRDPRPTKAHAGKPLDYDRLKGLSKPRYKEIVRESFDVPMKDGVELYVEVVRPKATGRYGTILELSPYHGTLADRSGTRIFPEPPDGLAGYFPPRGYAVVFVDLRGTGRSQGCLDHMGPKDQSDAYEIVEWAAKQKWSNGRVGMTGHSYVGSTPQMAAAQKPPHLKTIVPSAGLASMYHHEFQNGVPYSLQWAGPVVAYEQLAIERHLPGEDNPGGDMEYFGCGATQSAAVTGEAYTSGEYVEWHKERDFRKGATKAKIPVFIVHGVNDNAARIAAIDWFVDRNGRKGDKAWIGQWDHGSNCCPNRREGHWTLALHAWFDKHLLKRKVNTGPPVEAFLNDGSVWTTDQWPPRPQKQLKFYPQEGGKLGSNAGETTLSPFVADPRGYAQEFSTGNVAFVSEAFKKDTLIAGLPKLNLGIQVSSPRAHITATLYDVKGDTRDRIGQAAWAINPELRDGVANPKPVIPMEEMKIKLEGMSQAHLLAKGHKLELRIAASHPDKVPVFASGTVVNVIVGGDSATNFTIPVIENPKLWDDPLVD